MFQYLNWAGFPQVTLERSCYLCVFDTRWVFPLGSTKFQLNSFNRKKSKSNPSQRHHILRLFRTPWEQRRVDFMAFNKFPVNDHSFLYIYIWASLLWRKKKIGFLYSRNCFSLQLEKSRRRSLSRLQLPGILISSITWKSSLLPHISKDSPSPTSDCFFSLLSLAQFPLWLVLGIFVCVHCPWASWFTLQAS